MYCCINNEILSGLTTGETKFDLFSLSRHHFTLSCMKIPLKRCRNRRSEGWTSRNLAVSEDFWMPWCSSFSGKTIRVAQLPIKRPNFTILISLAHKIVMNGQNGKFNSWLVNIQVNLTKTPFLILTILFYYEIQHEVCYEITEFFYRITVYLPNSSPTWSGTLLESLSPIFSSPFSSSSDVSPSGHFSSIHCGSM